MALFRLLVGGVSALALSACQSGIPAGAKKLDAAELRGKVVNMTSYGAGQDNREYMSYAAPDGTIKVRGENFTDKGTYRIGDDGQICIKWEKIRNGVDTCLTIWFADGKDYSVLPDGSVSSVTYQRKPGNAEYL